MAAFCGRGLVFGLGLICVALSPKKSISELSKLSLLILFYATNYLVKYQVVQDSYFVDLINTLVYYVL